MRKKHLVITGLVVAIALFFINHNYTEETIQLDSEGNYISKYAWISSKTWESIDPTESGFTSPVELLTEVDEDVEEILDLIDEKNWIDELKVNNGEDFDHRIEIKFTHDISRAYGGGAQNNASKIRPRIQINKRLLEAGVSPIAHELTHIISSYSESTSFNEGLACYVQDIVGNNITVPNTGDPIHQLAKEHLKGEFAYISNHLGSTEKFDQYGSTYSIERRVFYIFSSSFTRYLVEEYGMEKYLGLYESKFTEADFNNLYGLNRDTLIMKWKEMLIHTQSES